MSLPAPATVLPATSPEGPGRPLCVDLDGTLLLTDSLWETLALLLRLRPLALLAVPAGLLRGLAPFKRRLAQAVPLAVERLPYDQAMIAWLVAERSRGRRVLLVSASDQLTLDRIAGHLGLFDAVLGSDGVTNLRGPAKAQALADRFGRDFAYVGDSRADLAVWRQSDEAIIVASSTSVMAAARQSGQPFTTFPRARDRWAWLESLRPLHWTKNLLMFIPLVTAHLLADGRDWRCLWLAFAAFSLVASGVYVLNDLLDLESDRSHQAKRLRPLASGRLPLSWGFALPLPLCLAGIAVALPLPRGAIAVLGFYIVLTSLYSFRLKRIALVDIFGLAILYSVRIVEGHEATGIAYSPWLLAFSLFMFISLAFAKRASELVKLGAQGAIRVPGRGYQTQDISVVSAAGISSGLCACIVCILYLSSSVVQRLYLQPELLWLLSPALLYWVTRLWLLTGRGQMNEDPILFALRDPVTYAIAAWAFLIIALASHSWLPRLNFIH